MKKFIIFIMCFVMLAPLCLGAKCAAAAAVPETTAKSVIITDYSGNIIYEKNSHEKLPPASVTKIMTMLLVIEAIHNGKISYDDMVTASEHASSLGGSQIYLKVGEQMSVRDMIKSVAVASANDAAVALAEFVAGSEESFVSLMNEKARALGMEDTTFINCYGLDTDGHVTSAADIAKMSAALLSYDDITQFSTIWMDTIRDGQFGLSNTNKLIKTFNGITGLKTGFTQKAMYCLSASAKRDGVGFITVLMGCPSSKERFADAANLLNYAFANYTSYELKSSQPLPTVPVKLGETDYVHTELKSASPILLEKTDVSKITQKISIYENVQAPVEKGQKLGEISFFIDDKNIANSDIVAADDVFRLTIAKIFGRIVSALFMRSNS